MKTFDEIYVELCSDFTRQTGVTLNDGGDMAIRLKATAAELHSLWIQADFVKQQMFPQLAGCEYLDYHAQLRGIERTRASVAAGKINFYINETRTDALNINSGIRCYTGAGVQFLTTEPCVIEAGALTASVNAVAELPGRGGNVPAGSITKMTLAPVGVSACGNIAAFSGGTDTETDDSLRARVLSSYKRLPNGANAAYYETQVLGMQGVAAVAIKPRARGLGTVDIVVASIDGVPSPEVLAKIEDELQRQREICVSIRVLPPIESPVAVSIALKLQSGYDFETVRAALESRVREYFSGLLLEKPILGAKLGDLIFHIEGVENYRIILPSTDLQSGDRILPVLGSLSISEMG